MKNQTIFPGNEAAVLLLAVVLGILGTCIACTTASLMPEKQSCRHRTHAGACQLQRAERLL